MPTYLPPTGDQAQSPVAAAIVFSTAILCSTAVVITILILAFS